MKKIKLAVIVLIGMIFLCGCGSSTKDNVVQIGETAVNLNRIEVNEAIGTVRREFHVSGKLAVSDDFLNNVFPENLLTVSIERENDNNVIITETRFYESQEEWWQIDYNLGGSFEEYTFAAVEPERSTAKEFSAESDGKQVSVLVTPYAVSINGEEGWIQEKKLYQIVAVMKDESQQEIYTLPFRKDKKMEERELLSLPYLGDGFLIGEEIKSENGVATGGRLILNQEIDPEQIIKVYIY